MTNYEVKIGFSTIHLKSDIHPVSRPFLRGLKSGTTIQICTQIGCL